MNIDDRQELVSKLIEVWQGLRQYPEAEAIRREILAIACKIETI